MDPFDHILRFSSEHFFNCSHNCFNSAKRLSTLDFSNGYDDFTFSEIIFNFFNESVIVKRFTVSSFDAICASNNSFVAMNRYVLFLIKYQQKLLHLLQLDLDYFHNEHRLILVSFHQDNFYEYYIFDKNYQPYCLFVLNVAFLHDDVNELKH
ncbi:hypothetical protein DERP_002427 [Dermatophagoides pteronyssinus]|uniref:Uncharacterized protein n=1 Tax=Dermatophagoides pteronyssinus TaxID=6956 RepID=A0ABQ8JI82_DERPT|nr:hypothetical protein DERP_002427 [Dermatophagoides pteronyssinus]